MGIFGLFGKKKKQQSREVPAQQPEREPGRRLFLAASNAIDAGDYENGIPMMEKAAEAGYMWAQFHCGEMYFFGEGTETDNEKALYWYEKSAAQGHLESIYRCTESYADGLGTPEDQAKCLYWYEKGAELGDDFSQGECCKMYFNGIGCEADYVKSLRWGLMSMESSVDSEVAFCCARIYHQGLGTARDTAKAAELYNKVNNEFLEEAMLLRGDIYYNGDGVPADKAEALRCYSEAAKEGNDEALIKCGTMYCHGEGTERSSAAAFEKFMDAARNGDEESALICGCLYLASSGTEDGIKDAAVWLGMAGRRGGKPAQEALERLVENIGDDDMLYNIAMKLMRSADYVPARLMLTAAAEHGHVGAKVALSSIYWKGKGVEQDLRKALALEEEAAAAGSEEAKDHVWELRELLGEY